MIIIPIDEVIVRLREPHDLRFLKQLGRVFRVFDEQDSGNIAFGVDTGTEKLLIKYAGARTIGSNHEPEDAIGKLREAMPVYQALRHPSLVELREHFATSGGYAAVFSWFEGECLRPSGKSALHPGSPLERHRRLPMGRRLETLDTILAFHEHVCRKGFVAIDFYDGSILYDFASHITKICDIDYYARLPYTNTIGRMWGSSRFMSPEEFQMGAQIDELTNVFNMGATAFVLLGGARDRSLEMWEGSPTQYEIACKATHPDRSRRYSSLSEFRRAWNGARELP